MCACQSMLSVKTVMYACLCSHRYDTDYENSISMYIRMFSCMCSRMHSGSSCRLGLWFDLGGYSFWMHETTPRATSTGPGLKLEAYLFLLSLLPLHLVLTASHNLVLRLAHLVKDLVDPCQNCLWVWKHMCVVLTFALQTPKVVTQTIESILPGTKDSPALMQAISPRRHVLIHQELIYRSIHPKSYLDTNPRRTYTNT